MTIPDEKYLSSVYRLNEDFYNTEGRKRLARVLTFGCKMNENDSEKIMGLLVEMGFDIERPPASGRFGNPAPLGSIGALNADDAADANACLPELVVLNTCCVRGNAEQRLFGILGSLRKYKSDNPSRVLAVCGCMMQEEKAVSRVRAKYGYVDFIFGTKSISKLPSLLYDSYQKQKINNKPGDSRQKKAIPVMNDIGGPDLEIDLPMYRKDPPMALISVMNGCGNFCSYCIVPYVRGREQSRRPESVEDEARLLASGGYREITLLGQNVNSYGNDLTTGLCDFPGLLERLSAIKGILRIRFMTSHPKDLSDKLIFAIKNLDTVCPQLHLPVQSGSTRVLERMNRGYRREDYLGLVRKIKEAIPGVVLTTDIIVGFPGESENDFDDTLNLVNEAEFDLAYTFLYSPREGTAAAEFPDQVPDGVAKNRFNRLLALQNHISYAKNLAMVGDVVEVLCEGVSKTTGERFTGRTPGGKVVNFLPGKTAPDGEGSPNAGEAGGRAGRLAYVRVDAARTWSLDGTAVKWGL